MDIGFGAADIYQLGKKIKLGAQGLKLSSIIQIDRRRLHTANDQTVFLTVTGAVIVCAGRRSNAASHNGAVSSELPPHLCDTKAKTQKASPMHPTLITRGDNILGSIPVLAGKRVPVKPLFDYLKANYPLEEFGDDFPSVAKQQAQQVIEAARRQFEEADNTAALLGT